MGRNINRDEKQNTKKSLEHIENTASSRADSRPHLLMYAHYYVPDSASTGQILAELAEGLLDQFKVSVICVVPSYTGTVSESYKSEKYFFENINGVDVIRVKVPEFTKSDKISRVKNILVYFFRAMAATRKVQNVDYILSVSQPPILGGLLGVWGKWTKRGKFIYQIQDFNPEQILAVNYSKSKLITDVMMRLDKFNCKRADLVITVGRDLVETLKGRFTDKNGVVTKKCPKVALINNWIDENEIYPLEPTHPRVMDFKAKYGLEDKFVIMYSGNIGLYYDLENLIKVIRKFNKAKTSDGSEVVFAFVGTGSVLDNLELYVKTHKMDNVTFIPYQDKADLIYSLNAGDVHWCVNTKGIKGVSCPSKYYGLAACAKPVLGVLEKGSEVRCLIEETQGGYVSDPGDYDHVERHIRLFIEKAETVEIDTMGRNGYVYLHENLTREKSVRKYAEEIQKL